MLAAPPGWKDISMVVRDGRIIESSWAGVRLVDGSFIGIGIDVTDRKEAEKALREYATKLEALNRDLEDFTFIASHDLQEPLRKIQVFSDLVLEKYAASLGEAGRDYLERLSSSANRVQELITSIRSYSKLASDLEPFEPVDLKSILHGAVAKLEVRIQETGARVEIGALPFIEGDPYLMRLVFENILSNALKYRAADPPAIRISSKDTGGSRSHPGGG
jgi:light-regulated signal transduction histidine kinase (bacteriophytochrome)